MGKALELIGKLKLCTQIYIDPSLIHPIPRPISSRSHLLFEPCFPELLVPYGERLCHRDVGSVPEVAEEGGTERCQDDVRIAKLPDQRGRCASGVLWWSVIVS